MSEEERLKTEIVALQLELETARGHEELLHALADTDQRGIVFLDGAGFCVRANVTAGKLFGLPKDEVLGRYVLDYVDNDSKAIVAVNLRTSETVPYEITCRREDGTIFPALVQGISGTYGGKVLRIVAIRDLTEMKDDQKRLETAHAEFKSIFDNSMVGILVLRGGRTIYRCNQRFVEMFGYSSDAELVGKGVSCIHVSDKHFREFGDLYFTTLVRGGHTQVEFPFKKKDGSHFLVSLSGKAIDLSYPPDLDKGVVWIMEDITRRHAAEKKLVELASRDELTGLFNRRYFMEQSGRQFDTFLRSGRGFSLLMLDIDYFKVINDTYGHGIGDEALKAFSSVCMRCLRSIDIMGRLGGEEFAVLLPDTDQEFALTIAERIRYAVEFSVTDIGCNIPPMTVSIGVATVKIGTVSFEETLREADQALYQAKDRGRNRVEVVVDLNDKDSTH